MAEKADTVVEEVAPGIIRVRAPNPSPMTELGTNSYLLVGRSVAIVDPGPAIAVHRDALLDAAAGRDIDMILVTHAHRDHSALAPELSRITGAPVVGFGPPDAGRSPAMSALAAAGHAGGGEGVDTGFFPDRRVCEGDIIEGAGWRAEALHTPGHFAGHLSFRVGGAILTGDTVMGWASSLVSPPDGSVAAFIASCDRLADAGAEAFLPGHGARVMDPAGRARELAEHRRTRDRAILAALGPQPRAIPDIRREVYGRVASGLEAAADRNVFAHLVEMVERSDAMAEPKLAPDACFRRR